MTSTDDKKKRDWAAFAEKAKRNHRPHAGHFSWETNRATAESGVLQEFEKALTEQNRLFFKEATHRGGSNDPPDCEAIGRNGERVGIEITELVDSKSAAAAREGVEYKWKDWKGTLLPELEKILFKKDSPSDLKDPPYKEYVLVVFSDEPWIENEYVDQQLANYRFPPMKLITRAFLLLSYSPFIRAYPCHELQINT